MVPRCLSIVYNRNQQKLPDKFKMSLRDTEKTNSDGQNVSTGNV